MSSLPFDVWANIVGWLPQEFLRGLYSVNKALFKLSLDERYRHLELASRDTFGDIHGKLLRLENDPFRAQKVKELTLVLHWAEGWLAGYDGFNWASAVQKGGFEGLYQKSPKKAKRWGSRRQGHPDETELKLALLQRSLNTLLTLPNIHRCTITDRVRSENEFTLPTMAIPFVRAAWRVSSASFQHLHLDILVEMMEDVLTPGLIFEALKHLEVDLSMLYRSTDTMGIIASHLVPFINQHHHLLQTFAFRTEEHLPLTHMFTQLQTMPHLRSLDISQGYVSTLQTDTSGLRDILERHAEDLSSLTLSFHALGTNLVLDPALTDWSEQAFLRTSYPKLHKLTFNFYNFPDGFSEKMPQILDGYWSETLRRLELRMSSSERELTVEDVRTIFSKVPKEIKLDLLLLRLDCPTLELFEVLAETLPKLIDLRLEIPPGNSVPEFMEHYGRLHLDSDNRTFAHGL